jgi:hypothetical protein
MNFEGMGEKKKKKTPSTINHPANITSADPIGRGHHTFQQQRERGFWPLGDIARVTRRP